MFSGMKQAVLGAVLALGLAVSAQATPINGAIAMSGGYSTDTGDTATATMIDFDPAGGGTGVLIVNQSTGDLSSIAPFTLGTIRDLTFNPFSGPINTFYSVGGLTFDLQTLSIVNQDATEIRLTGTGVMHFGTFDATLGDFQFTAQVNQFGNTFAFSWSASSGGSGLPVVPEPATLALLGIGLAAAGAGLRRRK